MLKTKLGISIALVGAAVYFLGMLGMTPAILLAGYILIAEQNAWLKRQAARAVGVLIFFGLLGVFVGWFDEAASILNIIVHWFDKSATYLSIPANLTSFCRYIISIVSDIFLAVMGFMALQMKEIRIGVIDKLLDKFMSENPQQM